MQSNVIKFSPYEYEVMQDAGFMLAKQKIMEKTAFLFDELQQEMERTLFPYLPVIEDKWGIQFQNPKISRGENYRGLPYRVLDYPKYLDKENILTFRSMFWWGNFFSFTLHIQGELWKGSKLTLPPDLHLRHELYASVGDEPWEYHYEQDNYVLLGNGNMNAVMEERRQHEFLKLSIKFPLQTPTDEMLAEALTFYQQLVAAL